MITDLDGGGVTGYILHFSMIMALGLSTLLLFFYLKKKGRLDMDEEAKYAIFEEE
jgi:hypothetical protein